jgi:hypothetical protein
MMRSDWECLSASEFVMCGALSDNKGIADELSLGAQSLQFAGGL